MTPALAEGIVQGGYSLREPSPKGEIAVAYTSTVAPDAIKAVGRMVEGRRDIGQLAITSAERLHAD